MAVKKKQASKAPDGFQEKWWKKLPATWQDTSFVDSKDNDELKKDIMKSEHLVSDTEKDMDADIKLSTLKEDLKDLKGGYMDVINSERAKIKYSLFLLKCRGVR